jgi:hypothetical protein
MGLSVQRVINWEAARARRKRAALRMSRRPAASSVAASLT